MSDKPKHRGRIQAQGGGLEASESWSQEEPLSKEAGLSLLSRLFGRLSDRDRALREQPYQEASRFIEQVDGGIDAPLRRTFQNRKTRDVRIDIEVWGGIAFISFTLIAILLWKLI